MKTFSEVYGKLNEERTSLIRVGLLCERRAQAKQLKQIREVLNKFDDVRDNLIIDEYGCSLSIIVPWSEKETIQEALENFPGKYVGWTVLKYV